MEYSIPRTIAVCKELHTSLICLTGLALLRRKTTKKRLYSNYLRDIPPSRLTTLHRLCPNQIKTIAPRDENHTGNAPKPPKYSIPRLFYEASSIPRNMQIQRYFIPRYYPFYASLKWITKTLQTTVFQQATKNESSSVKTYNRLCG